MTTRDAILYLTLNDCLHPSASCVTVPHPQCNISRTEQQKHVNVLYNVALGLMVLWQKKKKENMLQLIAECMFCNFITKALFYAKYFDIFVTTVVFC